MATIAENLITLNETKQAIKTAIEEKGQDLTDVPFTEYADKIEAITSGVKPNPVPLTVTENGVYENEQGFSPVTVDVPIPKVKPFTFTKNGVYDVSGGEIKGANPITVNVQIPINTLEVTANGTYTAKEGEAFNPVTVNIERGIKKYLEAGGLFYNSSVEDYRPILEYSDTENLIAPKSLWQRNFNLKYVPMLDFRKCTTTYYWFTQCQSLVGDELPLFELSNVGDWQGMFANCTALKVVPAYDMRNAWTANNMFNPCTLVEEIWIKNIPVNISVGSGTSWGHLLTQESALSLCKECVKPTNANHRRTITFATPVYDNLETLYVKLVTITDEMRVEDDLIDQKLPFELCESTDEGAMTIASYMALKRWSIAK
jgi:hypothetical protein